MSQSEGTTTGFLEFLSYDVIRFSKKVEKEGLTPSLREQGLLLFDKIRVASEKESINGFEELVEFSRTFHRFLKMK